MKLISINIELNRHTNTVLQLLKREKPDVVCMQELLEEEFEFYKNEINFQGVFSATKYTRSLSVYPDNVGKRHGVAIFARKITDKGSEFYFGSKEDVTKPFDLENFNESESLVWAKIEDSDGKFYIYVTAHLPVTKNGESTKEQLNVLEKLLEKIDSLGEIVLCGDMNAPRGNETFNRLAKKYKDNIPPEYKTSIDQNLHRVKGIQFMVDCLFTTPSYKASNVRLIDGVSDHMANLAEITKN